MVWFACQSAARAAGIEKHISPRTRYNVMRGASEHSLRRVWVKKAIDGSMVAAKIEKGRLLRPLSKSGKVIGDALGNWAIWSVVEQSANEIGIEHFGAHDLRRTCAKLCRKNGGDLEQIKFLLGHSSIQTTERYLGS